VLSLTQEPVVGKLLAVITEGDIGGKKCGHRKYERTGVVNKPTFTSDHFYPLNAEKQLDHGR
jgi:hypothetical protein